MPNRYILFLLALVAVSGAFGTEIQRGKLKVVINDRTGRYTVFGAEDVAKPTWTALFAAEDPTTSKWKVQVGDKTYVLGDDAAFTTAVESTTTGARIVWTSKALVATCSLDFVLSSGSAVADGLRLSLSLVNVSESSQKVAIRWLLDTSLGEKKDHFRLATGESISSESKLESPLPDWWLSTASNDDALGLVVMMGKGATPPSRVYFANWKRLNDAPWEPTYKAGRDFNQMPYSFNDSAVVHVYDAQDVASGGTREITVMLGLKSAKTLEGARLGSANPIDDLLKKNQDPGLSALDQDLVGLKTLIGQIDAKLADPTKVTAEDLRLLQAVLDQIEARKKALETTKP